MFLHYYPVVMQVLMLSFAILAAVASTISTTVTSIAVVCFLVFSLLSYNFRQLCINAWQNPVAKALVVFVLWLLISSLYSGNDFKQISSTLLSWKKLLIVFLLLGLPVTNVWKNRFLQAFILFQLVDGVLSIAYWMLYGEYLGDLMINNDAQAMGFMFMIASSLWLWFENQVVNRWVLVFSILIGLINIFYISVSRSCLVALPVILGVIFYQKIRLRKIPVVILVVAAVFSVFAYTSQTLKSRVSLAIEEQKNHETISDITSVGIRMVFYKNTLALIKDKPVFGYGTSAFPKTYAEYVSHKTGVQATPTTDPHNQYLFILVENGMIGLFLFIVYILTVFKQFKSCNIYSSIAVTIFLIVTITSFFNSHFKTSSEGHLLAFFVGFLLNTFPQKENEGNAGDK